MNSIQGSGAYLGFLHKILKIGAEDEGFEPSVGCPTHAFQACALGRYANPPVLLTRLKGIGGDD